MPFFERDITQYRFYRDLGVDPEDGDTDHGDGDFNCKRYGRSFRKNKAMSNREKELRNFARHGELNSIDLKQTFLIFIEKQIGEGIPSPTTQMQKSQMRFMTIKYLLKEMVNIKPYLNQDYLSGAKEVYELMGGSWSDLMEGIAKGGSTEIEKFKKTFEKAISVMNNPRLLRRLGSDGRKLRKAFQKVNGATKEIKRKFAHRIRKYDLPKLCKTKDEKKTNVMVIRRLSKHNKTANG